jgi:hypothetical protein
MRANGACSNQDWWFGNINQATQPWTVLVGTQASSQLVPAAIAKAWE